MGKKETVKTKPVVNEKVKKLEEKLNETPDLTKVMQEEVKKDDVVADDAKPSIDEDINKTIEEVKDYKENTIDKIVADINPQGNIVDLEKQIDEVIKEGEKLKEKLTEISNNPKIKGNFTYFWNGCNYDF